MKKRIYVGICEHGARAVVRTAYRLERCNYETACSLLSTRDYRAMIGPFRTVRAARLMADHGGGNPHIQCVADAEQIARGQP